MTYRGDVEFGAPGPFGLTYPASWHRAVAVRVADRTVNIQFSVEGHECD